MGKGGQELPTVSVAGDPGLLACVLPSDATPRAACHPPAFPLGGTSYLVASISACSGPSLGSPKLGLLWSQANGSLLLGPRAAALQPSQPPLKKTRSVKVVAKDVACTLAA